MNELYDVVIVGGGPAGLSAALVLGRSRKHVLVLDAGAPRNAAAKEMHGFLSRDGTPPTELRRIAWEQMAPYTSVVPCRARANRIEGTRGAFEIHTDEGVVRARRVLLSTGLVDELPEMPGVRELWGEGVVLCPYCHGWEVRDRAIGYLVPSAEWLGFTLLLRGWSANVIAFTQGPIEIPTELTAQLAAADVRIETRPIRRLIGRDGDHLEAVELEDGSRIARDVLFMRTRQHQTELVQSTGVALDGGGFVVVSDAMETSRPGIYAAGDLTTMAQAALLAAAAGARAAYAINHELTVELATLGALPA